jgi:hypothetical protein
MEQIQQVSFLHLHTCVYIFTIYSLLYTLSPLVEPTPLGKTCSTLLFSDFAEKKEKIFFNDIFLLV